MDQTTIPSSRSPVAPDFLRSVQIIYLAMTIGVTLLGAVSLFLYFNGLKSDAAASQAFKMTDVFNWSLIALALFGFWLGEQLFRRLLAKRIPAHLNQADVEAWRLQNVRSAVITKAVIYEMMASLGWFAFLLMVFQRTIYENSLYWLDTVPYIIFIYMVLNKWPNAERLQSFLRAGQHNLR